MSPVTVKMRSLTANEPCDCKNVLSHGKTWLAKDLSSLPSGVQAPLRGAGD